MSIPGKPLNRLEHSCDYESVGRAFESPGAHHLTHLKVGHALAGDWEAAHTIVQEFEEDATAAWIHAVAHRIEGDLANAYYWYRRCHRDLREDVSSQDELREIEKALGA